MDDTSAAAIRRLTSAAYVAAQAGLSDAEMIAALTAGVTEYRKHAALRAPVVSDAWDERGHRAA